MWRFGDATAGRGIFDGNGRIAKLALRMIGSVGRLDQHKLRTGRLLVLGGSGKTSPFQRASTFE
jgi:hypothetical protein